MLSVKPQKRFFLKENQRLKKTAFPTGMLIVERQTLTFSGEKGPAPESPKETFSAYKLMITLKRKFTSYHLFKQSLSSGYQASKTDLVNTFKNGTRTQMVTRVSMETLGAIVCVIF